jgi:hypothetical protein
MLNKNSLLLVLTILVFSLSCKKKDKTIVVVNTTTPNDQHISVLTQHNNNFRAGLNNRETALTTSNVNSAKFGKLFNLSVDDQVYAQPLVFGNLTIGGGDHNVVFIATVSNSVYAYDGDSGTLYWHKNYSASGMRPPKNTDMTGACGGQYQDFSGNIGIVGTPVIDSASQTIYFVARSTDGTNFYQYLHAVNIVNGSEQAGSPVKITASVPGTGDGNVNGVVSFDPQRNNQRAALTLLNGVVYVNYSSHCDWGPYHGWILGYNSGTLQQQIVYNDTPNGGDGGIWESGMGMAADAQGNLYAVVGNGTVGANNDPTVLTNRGESALKLTPTGSTLVVSSYYTPFNFQILENNDLDYGCMGAFLIPNYNYYFTGCKDGNIYVLNKDNMGGYNATSDQIQQIITLSSNSNNHCQPAYYKGSATEFAYIWPENDQLRAFPFSRSSNSFTVSNEVISTVSGPTGQSGAVISVSSNGAVDGTGIVWTSYAASGDAEHTVSPGILRAFDANNITKELWNNSQTPGDGAGSFAKFSSPTIANGHVYLPTFSDQVAVYGLK